MGKLKEEAQEAGFNTFWIFVNWVDKVDGKWDAITIEGAMNSLCNGPC